MQTEALPLPKVYGMRGPARFLPAFCLATSILFGAEAFLVIVPSIYQFVATIVPTSQQATIAILLIAAALMIWASSVYARVKLVISQEGLTYHFLAYSIYTPWENILAIYNTTTKLGRQGIPAQGLKLRTSARTDITLEQGKEQHIAVMKRRWLAGSVLAIKNFPADFIRLDSSIVGQNLQKHAVGMYLRRYAPQLFEHQEPIDEPDTNEHLYNQPINKSSAKEHLYPAFLSLWGKTCTVVGGGHVALRKVRSLLPTGANIVIISPQLHPELQTLLTTGSIHHIPGTYSKEHLAGATLVFVATDDSAINQQVAQDARQQGLWTNIADNPDESDFHVPATIHRQDLTLAISTAGSSPAFARYVRELLEQALHESLGQALDMIAQARSRILAAPKAQQAQLWDSLLSLHLETVIETEGYTAARSQFEHWLAQKGLSSYD